MTAIASNISGIRDEFLAALKDTQLGTELLSEMASELARAPNILEPLLTNEHCAINGQQPYWSRDYFNKQKAFARVNFAKERLEHLIEVREFLRQRGDKGFAPIAESRHSVAPQNPQSQSDYQPTNNLKKFVAQGDLLTIRTALRIEFNDNRLDDHQLYAAVNWMKAQVPDIFENYSEKAFARGIDTDSSQWTPEYFGNQVVYLKTNFAEKRFLHLIEVRQLLRERGEEDFAPADVAETKASSRARSASQAPQRLRSGSHQSAVAGHSEMNPAFKAALLIGGAIAAVVVFLIALVR
jgi:hypothetical protein